MTDQPTNTNRDEVLASSSGEAATGRTSGNGVVPIPSLDQPTVERIAELLLDLKRQCPRSSHVTADHALCIDGECINCRAAALVQQQAESLENAWIQVKLLRDAIREVTGSRADGVDMPAELSRWVQQQAEELSITRADADEKALNLQAIREQHSGPPPVDGRRTAPARARLRHVPSWRHDA